MQACAPTRSVCGDPPEQPARPRLEPTSEPSVWPASIRLRTAAGWAVGGRGEERLRPLLVRAALVAAMAYPSPALADMVMPPPKNCPPGQVGVTGHSGPRCLEAAPKNCPPGWTGLVGGKCRLRPCDSDDQCEDTQRCVEHSACLTPFEDPFYDYGEEPRAGGFEGRAFNLFGGDAPGRQRRPAPITRFNAVNVCGPKVACEAPSSCQPQKLCVVIGRLAAPYVGKNIEPVRVSRKIEPAQPPTTAPTASAAPSAPSAPTAPSPTAPAAPPPSAPPPPPEVHGGGCGGCSAPGDDGARVAAASVAVLAAMASWRGRGRGRRRPTHSRSRG